MLLTRTTEGATKLLVPKGSLSPVPPSVPVFYNPAAAVNRSISVSVVVATDGRSFCDALAGAGARGLRVATEGGRDLEVTMADVNLDGLKLARRSARLNGVGLRCTLEHSEGNSYLYSRFGKDERFDYVDIDPFGSPVPFLQAALRATKDGGVASFTATDTAVLCGVHPSVALRRYGASTLNNHFHHETGLRILLNAIRREAASLDLGVTAVMAHSTLHYMRVYVRVHAGASKADEGTRHVGYVVWCLKCGHTAESRSADEVRACTRCGARTRRAGPMWLGPLTEEETARKAAVAARRLGFVEAAKVLASISGTDALPPWSFSFERACSALRIPSVSDAAVMDALNAKGWRTMRQPYEKTGVKTDADYRDVVEAVAEVAKGRSLKT